MSAHVPQGDAIAACFAAPVFARCPESSDSSDDEPATKQVVGAAGPSCEALASFILDKKPKLAARVNMATALGQVEITLGAAFPEKEYWPQPAAVSPSRCAASVCVFWYWPLVARSARWPPR